MAASTAASSQITQGFHARAQRLAGLAWVQEKAVLELERDLEGFDDDLVVETEVGCSCSNCGRAKQEVNS